MASRPAESSALAASSTCTLNIGVPSCQRLTAGVLVCVKQEGTPRLRSGGASTGFGYISEQYANHHSGACLVFKRQELIELVDEHRPHGNGDLFTYGRVTYQDQALTVPLPWTDVVDQGIEAVLDDFQIRKDAATHLYTTKNTDWESEQEFRIVYVQWDVPDENMDVPISIPFEASLDAIVLGEHFPDTERNVMQLRAGMPAEIDLLQCQWHSGVPILTG